MTTVVPERPPVADGQLRRWAFIDKVTGRARMATCMPGCDVDHSSDMETPTHPEDIWCERRGEDVLVPLNTNGFAEQFRLLGAKLVMIPFSRRPAERVPHAVIEFVDDHWMEGLDPDGLETVISTLEERVRALRGTHAGLVATRAAHGVA